MPGDESQDLAYTRIDSILERHPTLNKVIIRIGTNDSNGSVPYPSGVDCQGSACLNTFKGNLNVLINKIGLDPNDVWVALVPPAFNPDGTPNTARNSEIQEYNQIINKLDLHPLSGYQVGPDFFKFYYDSSSNPIKNLSSLFGNKVHPDAFGHVLDAYQLHNSIDPLHSYSLPMFLTGLSPLAYKQNLLGVGNQYYKDRTYTLTSIPSELTGENIIWIMTYNDDKNNTSPSFLQFNIPQSSTVYVAYDSRASSLPKWLQNNFGSAGFQIGVSESMGHFNVYKKSFSAGSVVLGGNMADGASGASSNYIVIVKKN